MIAPQGELERIDGGWLVKRVGDYEVQLVEMFSCARIIAQHVDDPPRTPSAYWCYYGPSRLVAATLAARAWDGSLESAPAGAQRSYDARRRLHPS